MAKKRKQTNQHPAKQQSQQSSKAEKDNPVLLNELLNPEIVSKLKAQAEEMKQTEANKKEEIRKQEEEKKKQEQKRLENDFAYLLDNSDPSWSKHK
ncbi:hypothetical protein FHS15_002811 [Paenibacillus castaneae]|uniref:DUF3886 domain-containing protein n=1 Tax=Paenibacillus castaneae TaxID=474957 RepID=UPI000C9C9684|nr:DUF3886 domain-containing protein [Paenibacillus castaneae]NIK77675.1 hypothetical protein [Paenibacillus castaneae]